MPIKFLASLLLLAAALSGCVVVPVGPPRRVYAPVAYVPVPVVAVRVVGVIR
jgi:hypothetical protein